MTLHYGKLETATLLAATVGIALALVANAAADEPPETVEFRELPCAAAVEKFLLAIEDRNIGAALEALGWSEEAAAKMTKPLAELVAIGPHDGHEIVAVRRVSPRLHQVYGVIHYAQKPVLFALYLRQFKGKWHIWTVNFGDDLKPLDEVAPLERVTEKKDSKVAVHLH